MYKWRSFCLIAALAFAGQNLLADTVTIGSANGANCVPFGCAGSYSITTYQQVYSSNSFGPLPFDIAAISFFKTLSPLPDAVTSATYDISFSTTSAAVGGLDPLLDLNIGVDNQVFFSGKLGGPMGTTLTIVGTKDFLYDPTQGNLLLDMTIFGASPDTNIALDVENFSSVMSRAAPGLSDPFNVGLVTEFHTTAPLPPSGVPEPSSVLLLGTGLLSLVALVRRKVRGGRCLGS